MLFVVVGDDCLNETLGIKLSPDWDPVTGQWSFQADHIHRHGVMAPRLREFWAGKAKKGYLIGTQHPVIDLNVIQKPLITVGPGVIRTGRVGIEWRSVDFFGADGQQQLTVEQ